MAKRRKIGFRKGINNVGNVHIIRRAGDPHLDAFGRDRTTSPLTLFDSKQIFDNEVIFWDDQEVSGTGTGSTHSTDTASTELAVGTVAGKRVRQTFRRFNYQPGKSQYVLMTGILAITGSSGVDKRLGIFDDDNGLYFRVADGVVSVGVRSSASGSVVDTEVPQANWNMETLENTLGLGVTTLDMDKTQIFVIDFEWLGTGRVRFGFYIDGEVRYVHQFNHANIETEVYMSTPNLPLRYEIEADGTGAASVVKHICSTVITEGGQDDTGIDHYLSNADTHVDADVVGVIYALVGVKLKAAFSGVDARPLHISALADTNNTFEWLLILNPTVAGVFTYGDEAGTPFQAARGALANTVTNGTILAGGYVERRGDIEVHISSQVALGEDIDGTQHEIVLCVRPLSSNLNIFGGLTMRRSA